MFDVEFPAKSQGTCSLRLIARVVKRGQVFFLILRIILDHQFERAGHCECPWCAWIERFADTVFKNTEFDILLVAGDPDSRAEVHQRLRWITPAPHAGERRHAWIIPAADYFLFDQDREEALADDRVFQGQTGKLCLIRAARCCHMFQHPVIQSPVVLKLERAQRMGNTLDGIGQRVGEIVHRIDAPPIAGVVMSLIANPVKRGVPKMQIG